jgi:urease subunit gamma/beta
LRPSDLEAVALIATRLLELICDGRSVAELMDLGRRLLGRGDVLDGIREMADEVEAPFRRAPRRELLALNRSVRAPNPSVRRAVLPFQDREPTR